MKPSQGLLAWGGELSLFGCGEGAADKPKRLTAGTLCAYRKDSIKEWPRSHQDNRAPLQGPQGPHRPVSGRRILALFRDVGGGR